MILSIFEQALITLPLIIGAYLTLSLLKVPDFSIESAYLFGAVMAFLAKDLSIGLMILSAISGGMIVALCVSFLNQFLRIPFLLAGIVVNGLFHGITQYFLGTSVKSFQVMMPLHEIIFLGIIGGILLTFLFFLLNSQLGFSFAIYGNNPKFFRSHSISERYIVSSGVLIAYGAAGISGFLFAQSNGFVDLTMNFGVILLCLTALMIGKLLISRRHPNFLVPLLGIILFFILQQSLLRAGLNLKYFNAFQAFFILTILSIGHRKKSLTLDHLGV